MDVRGFGLSEEDLRQLGFRVRPGQEGGGVEPSTGGTGRSARTKDPALRAWPVALVALVAVGWGSSVGRGLPRPLPVAAPDTAFSSARAMAQLVEVARAPRPVGSPEHGRVSSYLQRRLASLGLDAVSEARLVATRDSLGVRAATVRNVVARIPGIDPGARPVRVRTAYDGPPGSPAAAANGIGVAAVLEVARALSVGTPSRSDVEIVLLDAGAVGRLGEVSDSGATAGGRSTIDVEALGGRGPVVPLIAPGRHQARLVDAVPKRTTASVASRLFGVNGDARPRGEPVSVQLVVPGGRAVWGQSSDRAARVDERTLQMVGDELLAAVRVLASAGPAEVPGAVVYHALPFVGVASYPSQWVLPTAGGLLVAWGLLTLLVRARRAGRRGVLVGVALGLLLLGAAWGLGHGLVLLLEGVHAEIGSVDTLTYRDGPHLLALAFMVLGLAAGAYAVAQRLARPDELFLGASLLPLSFATWGAIAVPGAAPAVQWPLAMGLITMIYVTLLGPVRTRKAAGWVGVTVLTAVAVPVLVSSLELAAGAWTLLEAERFAAVVGVAALAFLPALALLTGPKAWLGPAAAAVAAAVLVGLQHPRVRSGAAHPVPSTLVYLTEEPVPSGPLVSRAPDAVLDHAAPRAMMGEWLTVPGPGERWSRSWVAEPASGPLDAGPLLVESATRAGRVLVDARYQRAGGAPNAEIPPPSAEVGTTTRAGARLTVDVSLASRLGAEMLGLVVPQDQDVRIVAVGDVALQHDGPSARRLTHWGSLGPAGLRVTLDAPTETDSVGFFIVEHHLRPAEVLGDYFFQRPDSLRANNALGSDRLVQRTFLRVAVTDGSVSAPEEGP